MKIIIALIISLKVLVFGNIHHNCGKQIENNVDFVLLNDTEAKSDYKEKDKHYIKLSELEKYKTEIFNITLSEFEYSKFPAKLKLLSNLKKANFQTASNFVKIRYSDFGAKHYIFNIESKVQSLPKWIVKLDKIEYLNLVGHKNINYKKAIKNLKKLVKLKELEIEIAEIKIDELNELISETSIQKLVIYKEKLNEAEINQLNEFSLSQKIIIEWENINRFRF